MALLAATHYDPSTAGNQSTASNIAMTAVDTTNLRLTFTGPANGIVKVRLRAATHGATSSPAILLGILDGATVKGRMAPMSHRAQNSATVGIMMQEATFLVTGLTPGTSYTWDAAYGVESLVASTGLKYGGPNNTTGGDAFGGFTYEIWDTRNLLAGTLYDPGTAVSKTATPSAAMAAFDTTNLRLTFTTNATGAGSTNVLVAIRGMMEGGTAVPQVLLGVLDGATVRGRQCAAYVAGDTTGAPLATSHSGIQILVPITGLTPSTSYTWDAAFGIEATAASQTIKYGGPNNTTADDAYGGLAYEIWAA